MVLRLSSPLRQQIESHAERCYPRECCGLMLGYAVGEEKEIAAVWETENAWNEETATTFDETAEFNTQERRYTIAAEVMLEAQKTSRDRGWQILGIYHSHPNHAAIPSEVDRSWAWPQYSYVIVSVQQGQAIDLRSWQLDEHHQFQAETVSA
ncbi:Mov34/MPN/PAD-1 family protein [Baaleninema sp.]|uniref:Mov34/MPN/PAD-1 family protein n=1 Tax=Baaleninema sp. TaxID=3101197 RepID=UPI003D06E827